MYNNVSNKYRRFKKLNYLMFFKKKLNLSIVYSKRGQEYKKIFKEEQSIGILNILGSINNIEGYQKIYNNA